MKKKTTLTKKDLIDNITEDLNFTKENVRKVVNRFVDEMRDKLVDGCNVNIVGLGKFDLCKKKAREGRDPVTHEKIDIKESTHVRYKMSTSLKMLVNKK